MTATIITPNNPTRPPVLFRSRSLLRGFVCSKGLVSVTMAPAALVWTCGDDGRRDGDDERSRRRRGGKSLSSGGVVDDSTEGDHAHRIAAASSKGLAYDEISGESRILGALTPHERAGMSDDRMPLRHYRAEKGDIDKAIRKIKSTIEWRKNFGVEDIMRCFDAEYKSGVSVEKREELDDLAEIIAEENATGKIYSRGYDRWGRAVIYLTPGRENSNHELNNMRHLVYHLERASACSLARSGREKVVIVVGYAGFSLSNAPPASTVKHTLRILQGHYPERMHRAYVCDPPWVFRTFWSVIRRFVDPSTLEKIAFCHGKEGTELLERDFDLSSTEPQAGGTRTLRTFDSTEFLYKTPFDLTFNE